MGRAAERCPCPVPGCGAAARAGHLMCRACWYAVPRRLQREVHATWRAYRRQIDGHERIAALRRYREAAEAALGAVETGR